MVDHMVDHTVNWVAISTLIWEEMGTRMVDDMIDYAINR